MKERKKKSWGGKNQWKERKRKIKNAYEWKMLNERKERNNKACERKSVIKKCI